MLSLLAAVSLFSADAEARPRFVVHAAPAAVVVRFPMPHVLFSPVIVAPGPRPGFVWVPGHRGGRGRWIEGHWAAVVAVR